MGGHLLIDHDAYCTLATNSADVAGYHHIPGGSALVGECKYPICRCRLDHCCVGLFGGHETTCGQQRNSDHRRSHCDLCSYGMHILPPKKSPLTGGWHLSA
eukprot:TRINITY_DN27475_c0_g2_i1.p3 TRINITY_DN27475_c0_g2~~TRINITY_DN27475_c0_g2_i1.p3  ORF type:complete len:101 (-),score=3.65 TRINITY_DN27475_c0_g2_i1:279-581(-)